MMHHHWRGSGTVIPVPAVEKANEIKHNAARLEMAAGSRHRFEITIPLVVVERALYRFGGVIVKILLMDGWIWGLEKGLMR